MLKNMLHAHTEESRKNTCEKLSSMESIKLVAWRSLFFLKEVTKQQERNRARRGREQERSKAEQSRATQQEK